MIITAGIIAGAVVLNLPSETDPAVIFTEASPASAEIITTSEAPVTTPAAVFPLDLNIAGKDELMQLPGIGEVLAGRITAYRREKLFASPEEVMQVDGIGNALYEKIRDKITVNVPEMPETTASETTSAKITEVSTTVTTQTSRTETVPETTVTTTIATTTATAATTETTVYIPELPIDINSAEIEDFTYLDGIGESLARRIISYRERHGGFYDVYELLNVNGFGKKTLESVLPYIWADTSGLPPITTVTEPELETLPTMPEPELPAEININTAKAADFASLPGVNRPLADNIVALRESIGGSFSSVYEILYADGMTDGIFNRIMPYLTL